MEGSCRWSHDCNEIFFFFSQRFCCRYGKRLNENMKLGMVKARKHVKVIDTVSTTYSKSHAKHMTNL